MRLRYIDQIKLRVALEPKEHQMSGPDGGPIRMITYDISTLKGLSDEELDVLERIARKLESPEELELTAVGDDTGREGPTQLS